MDNMLQGGEPLQRGERMLFALLRASLHGEPAVQELFQGAEQAHWQLCYTTAVRQGVLALAWDGITTLPMELHPPRQLKFQWAMSVEKYEAKHRRYCQSVQELQSFYAENGIVAVQMKGVGFSSNYNVPAHREGGDIDIYTYSADKRGMSHREANELADSLMQRLGIEVDTSHSYKHSNFYFKGIPVENHKFFLNVKTHPKFLGELNDILAECIDPREVTFHDGKYRILVPSPQFNMLFISCHAFQHYGSGIALHHLYDWAALIKNHGLQVPAQVKEENFLRAIAAFTHLANRYLGTAQDLQQLKVEGRAEGKAPDGYEKLAHEMLHEMLHPRFPAVVPHKDPVRILIYKTRKVLRSARLSRDVLGASPVRRLADSVVAHLKAPDTILSRGEK